MGGAVCGPIQSPILTWSFQTSRNKRLPVGIAAYPSMKPDAKLGIGKSGVAVSLGVAVANSLNWQDADISPKNKLKKTTTRRLILMSLFLFNDYSPFAAQRAALLALGRAAGRRPNGNRLRQRKRLKNAQTPQRQVHAVLGAFVLGFSQFRFIRRFE